MVVLQCVKEILDCKMLCLRLRFCLILMLKRWLILKIESFNGVGFNIYREPHHVSVDEDFMRLTPRCTIEKLIENKEGGSFIIMGTIKSAIEEGCWWYSSCHCGRSVLPEMGMYYCDVCMRYIFSVSLRMVEKIGSCLCNSDILTNTLKGG